MKLTDLKRTKAEKKEREKEMRLQGPAEEDYPYGTRVRLEHEDMEKLGLKDTPKPGAVFHIMAKGKVTHSHESADQHGKRRHVEIHLTHMGMEERKDKGREKSIREEIQDAAEKSEKK